jgi:hypothetical protein
MAIKLQKVELTGGVNSQLDPMSLRDNQFQSAKNFSGRQGQDPGARPSMAFAREIIPDYREWDSRRYDAATTSEAYFRWALNWRPAKFMFSPIGAGVAAVLVASADQQIIDANGEGKIAEAGTAILCMLPTLHAAIDYGSGALADGRGGLYCLDMGLLSRSPSMFMFDGILYAFGGANMGGRVIQTDLDPLRAELGWNYYKNEWNTLQSVPFIPEGAAVIRNRVLYYRGPNVFWSDVGDPLQIWPNALQDGFINITGENQEAITAVAELSTTADGSPMQSVAAIWTRTHCYLLLGEPAESIDDITETGILGSMQINRLNIECGCVSQATVTRTPYGSFWVGQDDVWFMPMGSLPIRVGTNIRPAIRSVPPALAYRICAEYENGFYRIALPGAELDGTSPLEEIWSLDLNNGVPQSSEQAAWWGPHTLVNGDSPASAGGGGAEPETGVSGIWAWARDQRANGDGKLYSLQTYIMFGGGTGIGDRVHGMSLCGWDTFGMRDIGCPILEPRPWQASTLYFPGDIVVPPPSTTDFRSPAFICTAEGTSGATEPTWDTSGVDIFHEGPSLEWRPEYYNGGKAMSSYRCLAQQQQNNVEWQLVSKEYTLEDAISEKLLDGAEIAFTSQVPQQLTYRTNPDQQLRSRVLGTIPTQVDNNTGTFVGFTNKQRKLMTADPTKRFNAQTAVMTLGADAGYVIVTGFNDFIDLLIDTGGGNGVTIPAGYYADIRDVFTAVHDALQTLTAGLVTLGAMWGDTGDVILGARFGMRDTGGLSVGLASYSVLAAYFGYTVAQVGTGNEVDPAVYFWANNSFEFKQSSDFQLNALNIRFGEFGRRPM